MLFLNRLGSVGTGPWQCEPHQPEDVPSAQWSCWSTSPLGEPHSLSLPTLTPHLTCGLQLFLNDQRRNSPGGSGCQEREASGKSHHGQPHPSVSTGQLSPPPVLIPFRARQLMCPATSLHRLALKSSQGREELHSKGQRSYPKPNVNQEEKVACLITSSLQHLPWHRTRHFAAIISNFPIHLTRMITTVPTEAQWGYCIHGHIASK